MKKIIVLLFGFSVLTGVYAAGAKADPDEKDLPIASVFNEDPLILDVEKDDVHYLYMTGEWLDMNGAKTTSMAFLRMYHEEGVEPPQVAEIPVAFKYLNDSYHVTGLFHRFDYYNNLPFKYQYLNDPKYLTFNTIIIPKEIYNTLNADYPTIEPSDWPFMLPDNLPKGEIEFENVYAAYFDVNEKNPAFCDVDGVLMTKDNKTLIRFPVRKEMINYYVPDYVESLGSAFSGIQFPVFPNDHCRSLMFRSAFKDYPFYGIYDTSGVHSPYIALYQSYSVNHLKALDHAFFGNGYKGAHAISFDAYGYSDYTINVENPVFFVDRNINVPGYTGMMPDWYDASSQLEIIELNSGTNTVEVQVYTDDYKGSDEPLTACFPDYAGERQIITYVRPGTTYSNYLALFDDKKWPQNAVIKPSEDVLYLYPELCHGPWTNGQTQFVYGACRFGQSSIAKREWTTDNPSVATVDETGVLTSLSGGNVTVSLTITDGNGIRYTASQNVEIRDPNYTGSAVREIEAERAHAYPAGVFNLHGIKVADTLDGALLPPGIYIADGKKIVLK